MTIDPVWMKRIKEIVNYGLNADLCVIINEHWDGGWMEHDAFTSGANVAEHKEMFRKLWTNIAKEFKTYDQRVLFAALNEPGVGGASPQVQGDMLAPDSKEFADRLLVYEQVFIDAVRATGGNNASRVLIVQTPKTEIDLAAKDSYDITRLKDKVKNCLMAEVHFYDPYIFTLMDKDADWGKVALYWKGHAPAEMMKAGLIPYVWDINVQPLPHMTIFDRKKQVVSDSYIFKGVMQGAAEGMEDYQKIYPKP